MRELSDNEIVAEFPSQGNPAKDLIDKERENLINEALEAAKARLKNDKERLIIDLFYVEGKKCKEIAIAPSFQMKEKAVFKVTEKFRKFFKEELKKRGILGFE